MRIRSIANQLMSNATTKKVGSKFIVIFSKGKNLTNYTKFPIGFGFKGLVIKGLTESDFKI